MIQEAETRTIIVNRSEEMIFEFRQFQNMLRVFTYHVNYAQLLAGVLGKCSLFLLLLKNPSPHLIFDDTHMFTV